MMSLNLPFQERCPNVTAGSPESLTMVELDVLDSMLGPNHPLCLRNLFRAYMVLLARAMTHISADQCAIVP